MTTKEIEQKLNRILNRLVNLQSEVRHLQCELAAKHKSAIKVCEYCDAGDPTSPFPYHSPENCPSPSAKPN